MMDKLTDLEICKRIAEIEGVELFNSYSIIFDKKVLVNMYMDKGIKWHRAAENEECFFTKVYTNPSQYHKAIYNPLTDDALCFKLMVKYKISLIQHQNNTAVYCIWDHDEKHATDTMTNANRAICTAIIQSKDQ